MCSTCPCVSSPYVRTWKLGSEYGFCTVAIVSGEREPDEDDVRRGERVKRLREAAGFRRQEDLATKLGINRVRYNRFETGKDRLTSRATQKLLADGLGVPLETLLAYLHGDTELDEVIARREGRWVERPGRYPLLERFVEHLRARKQDEAAIVELRAMVGDRKGDITSEAELVALWQEAIKVAKRRDALLGLEPVEDATPDVSPENLRRLATKKRSKK